MAAVWRRSNQDASEAQLKAESAIVDSLGGGDSLPAWNAVWDLVQSSDSQGKAEVLTALRDYVSSSVADDAGAVHAKEFEQAIDRSMTRPRVHREILPSRELRDQHEQDQLKSFQKALDDIGVRPGEGLPMWSLYMTRRSKRAWR